LEEPLKTFETLLQDYEEIEEESRTVEDKIIRLQLLDADIDCVDKTLEEVYDTTAIIEGFISESEALGKVKSKIELLQKYDQEIEDCATRLDSFVSELEKVGDISEILDIGRRIESIIKQIEEIEAFQADMSSKSEELNIARNELATAEKNLEKAMKAQKVCPTCKRPI
jgi:DNA repair exonuclease SbcCD ATPase subunit